MENVRLVKLARFLRSGDLTAVYVPDEATEAMRDLERARDDAKKAERAALHQLSKFLLRHGRRSPMKSRAYRYLEWVRRQHFEHAAQEVVLLDYLKTYEDLRERVARLTKRLEELVESWSQKPLVKALQALRGVNVISATIIVAELGDLSRFQTAPQLMGYLGLVPSEDARTSEDQAGGRLRARPKGEPSRVLWARLEAAGRPHLERGSPRRIQVMRYPIREYQIDPPSLPRSTSPADMTFRGKNEEPAPKDRLRA